MTNPDTPVSGAEDLQLPPELREPLHRHLDELRERYLDRDWGGRVGFGRRPAVVVIDLAELWTQPNTPMGSSLESVVNACVRLVAAARSSGVPVYFTTFAYDEADAPTPHDFKLRRSLGSSDTRRLVIDERLGRRPDEKILRKPYASAFKGTHLHDLLAARGIDTLVIAGVSTSHCVYATCRDATDSFRVIVPREAVGDRCELLHEVNLFDIDVDLGDVLPLDDVIAQLRASINDADPVPSSRQHRPG